MTDNRILAAYLRISKDDGRFGESQSIENQRKLIADYIASHPDLAAKTTAEFIDDGHTGLNFDRPNASLMLEMAKRGEIDCIIVKDFSRFSRDYIDAGDYLEQIFPFLGIRFISVNDGYDSAIHGSLAGDVGNGFKNLYNSYYSKDLSRKVRSGLLTKKQSGSYTPSRCPYGYKKAVRDGIGMEIDEEAAAVVRRIFAMTEEGVTTASIAKALNLDGIPTPLVHKHRTDGVLLGNAKSDKQLWTPDKVRSILRDIRYTGVFAYNMYRSKKMGTKETDKVPQDQWGCIPDAIPAIIPADAFDKVQPDKQNGNRGNRGGIGKRPLARKLQCGGCGYALYVNVYKQTCRCNRKEYHDNAACVGSAVDMAAIESVLTATIQRMLDICATESTAGSAAPSTNIREIRAIQQKIKASNDNKASLYDRYCDGDLSRDEYIKLRDEEDQVIAELNIELQELENRQAKPSIDMKERLSGFAWDGQLTREVANALIESVSVYNGGRLEIKWTFSNPILPES